MSTVKINLSDVQFRNLKWSGERTKSKLKLGSFSDLYPIVNGSTCQLGKLHRTYKSNIDQELLLSLVVSKFLNTKLRKNKQLDLDDIYEFRLLKEYFKVLAVRKILIAGYNVSVEGYLEEATEKNIDQLGKYLIQLDSKVEK